jgi:hypothetical protein
MKFRVMAALLAAGAASSAANGADLQILGRTSPPGTAVVRIADQGLGYSVVHQPTGLSPRPYRVHVTCTIGERFRQTYCPTAAYYSSCPRAEIICR